MHVGRILPGRDDLQGGIQADDRGVAEIIRQDPEFDRVSRITRQLPEFVGGEVLLRGVGAEQGAAVPSGVDRDPDRSVGAERRTAGNLVGHDLAGQRLEPPVAPRSSLEDGLGIAGLEEQRWDRLGLHGKEPFRSGLGFDDPAGIRVEGELLALDDELATLGCPHRIQ